MSFLILTNTVGDTRTAISTSGGTIATGYKAAWAIAGPRERNVKADSSTSHTFSYACASQSVTHCVVAGAYWFKNGLNAGNLDVKYSGGTDSSTAAGSMTLLGHHRQDWVKPIAQTGTSFSVTFNHSPASATFYSKVYFSNAIDLGNPPQLVSIRKERAEVRPILGYQKYVTEATIQLAWRAVSASDFDAFLGRPKIWPFFLYDEDGDIFDYKLEHVIIADPWVETRRIDGSYDLQLTVRRLVHEIL